MKQNQSLTMVAGAQSITSLEIARVTGKTHAHVLRDIRNMEPAWEQEHGTKFGFMQQKEDLPNGGYRLRPVFVLTKIESLYIATKFNDVARARLVLRWEELERAAALKNKEECIKMAAAPQPVQRLLVTEKEILRQGDEIRRQQIVDENAPSDGCMTVTDIAKICGLTVKELNSFLVDQGLQYWNGGRYRLKPECEGHGWAQNRIFHYYTLDGEKKQRLYLVWTQKGVEMIMNQLNIDH